MVSDNLAKEWSRISRKWSELIRSDLWKREKSTKSHKKPSNLCVKLNMMIINDDDDDDNDDEVSTNRKLAYT